MQPLDDSSPEPDAYAPAKHKAQLADDVAAEAVEYSPPKHSDAHAEVSPDAVE